MLPVGSPVDPQQLFTQLWDKKCFVSFFGRIESERERRFDGFVFPQPAVPKKPKRSVPVSSSLDREAGRSAAPLSREASDVAPTPAVRRTDVRTETQPNGSEVTTTIVEFTDQVGVRPPGGGEPA